MKEVTIVGYCDGTVHGDERVRSTIERVVSVDNSRPVTLDLCDECDLTVEALLMLMERGAVVKPNAAKKAPAKTPSKPAPSAEGAARNNAPLTSIPVEGPHICPECQFESVSRSALGQHLKVKHDKGFKDYIVKDEEQHQQAS